jgi:hypothetical protein
MKCLWCGEETTHPVRDLFAHFWIYQPAQWQYLKGNMATFGRWSGFWSTVELAFPMFNSLRHWRHRKTRLELK